MGSFTRTTGRVESLISGNLMPEGMNRFRDHGSLLGSDGGPRSPEGRWLHGTDYIHLECRVPLF